MKIFRKTIALLIVLVLLVGLSNGCNNTKELQDTPSMNSTSAVMSETGTSTEAKTRDELRTKKIVSSEDEEGKLVFRFLNNKGNKGGKWGDSTFIRFPNGKTMLIDAGEKAAVKDIIELLKMIGVKRIDFLVASHFHSDHIGGIPEIADNFEIGVFYSTVYAYDSWNSTYKKIEPRIKEGKHTLKRGDSLDIGDVHIDILNPDYDEITFNTLTKGDKNTTENIRLSNNNSLVMKFKYGQNSALFVGDIYAIRESEIVEAYGDELKADLLKIPHHGNGSSSTAEFINKVSPKVAVSMGDEIMTQFVYARYKNVGANVYQSNFDSCVKVKMSKTGDLEVTTEKDRTSEYFYN